MDFTVENMAAEDWEEVQSIYQESIATGNATFEVDAPDLTMTHCPPEWRWHDLYLFRDHDIVFYVGQSYNAFERIWEHLRGGSKGHSKVGRFILCNWTRSM